MTSRPFILDTDFSSDSDDVLDLKASWYLHRKGQINLLGVMCCSSNTYAPGAIQGALNFLDGALAPTIGTWRGTALDPGGPGAYTQDFYNTYTHTVGLANTVTSATTQYRTLLAARSSADVTIVATGFATNLRDLLDSPADGISGLTGAQLIAASVKELVIVAGFWPSSAAHGGGSAEFNIASDAANFSYLTANWPSSVVLTFCGVELGDAVGNVGSAALSLGTNDPVRKAFLDRNDVSGRPPWGVLGVLYGAAGGFTRTKGTATINSSTGANSFAASVSGAHGYLTFRDFDASHAGALIDKIVSCPNTAPYVSSWGTQAMARLATD